MTHIGREELVRQPYFKGDASVTLEFADHDSSLRIPSPEKNDVYSQVFAASEVKDYLNAITQLGLKELWIGSRVAKHTRWKHSVGAFNVGHIWMRTLEQDQRLPPSYDSEWLTRQRALVLNALLMHDFGHLPFSHLTEEVLAYLNWIPDATAGAAHGLESQVLHDRMSDTDTSGSLDEMLKELARFTKLELPDCKRSLESLIAGGYGLPWVQTIVNSPIDADKIDYVHFDSWFLEQSRYPLQPRINGDKRGWLEEFLQDQHVNHLGMLCLDGRSARAAADLWRERVLLYDRFYLAPDLRVPERIAAEIVQQWLIRCTLSDRFRGATKDNRLKGVVGLGKMFDDVDSIDPIVQKFRVASDVMTAYVDLTSSSVREFLTLQRMWDDLKSWSALSPAYLDVLERGMNVLSALEAYSSDNQLVESQPSPRSLRAVVEKSLVRQPLIIDAGSYRKAVEVLRPAQHAYCDEAFIDIVKLPLPLSPPRRWKSQESAGYGLDYQLLVPDGPASSWGPGKKACVPLTDESVVELERPFARVSVIVPDDGGSTRAAFVWDRIRALLLESGIELKES